MRKKINRNSETETYSVAAVKIILFCLSYFKFVKFSKRKIDQNYTKNFNCFLFFIIVHFFNLILNFQSLFKLSENDADLNFGRPNCRKFRLHFRKFRHLCPGFFANNRQIIGNFKQVTGSKMG